MKSSSGSLARGLSLFAFPALLSLGAWLPGCSATIDEGTPTATDEDDLTSLTARSRELRFEGLVYVEVGASDATILKAARAQSQSAFGALLALEISVESRELKDISPTTFKKREVTVFDTNNPGDRGKAQLEVKYQYRDNAVVPTALSRRTSLPLAVLGGAFDTEANRATIVAACTKNDKEARDDAASGLLWYDFNPSKASCKAAITDEQEKVDADRAKLADARTQVPRSQLDRLYVPATMSLGAAKTTRGSTYPEYDKLFSQGVTPGKLTIGALTGRLAHDHVEATKDDGYYEWMDMLGVVFEAHPGFTLTKIDPPEDITTVTVGNKRLEGLKFADVIQWTVYDIGYPSGLTAAEKTELRVKMAQKLDNHWLTFDMPTKVSINGGAAKEFGIVLNTSFGAEEGATPYKRAIKTSDVFVFNGHSYIGRGPLDPANFRASDFPSTYQLLFIDSCVSYNYYNEGYFLVKPGGTKVLDTITNGIEAPEYQSGMAEGQLIAKLIDGSMPSYQTLLREAKATDPMRVVDGEVDNTYSPTRTPIKLVRP
ncbi:MAG TPA: hypothetical protein PK141_18040 [Polyangiaceae bacterium]|nr:hypothetical protein [Polyangiaceae bacterium]